MQIIISFLFWQRLESKENGDASSETYRVFPVRLTGMPLLRLRGLPLVRPTGMPSLKLRGMPLVRPTGMPPLRLRGMPHRGIYSIGVTLPLFSEFSIP